MLNYNEIRERVYIVLDGEPYEALDSHVFRKQQRKPVNQVKLRNLITKSVKNHTFHNNDSVEEAELDSKTFTYSFSKFNRQKDETEYWFLEDNDKSKRVTIDSSLVGDQIKFLKPNSDVEALIFKDNIIGIKLPVKVSLKVIEAPPAVRGNSEGAVTKQVKVETGAMVNVPVFIKEGEEIVIRTETGEYVERVK